MWIQLAWLAFAGFPAVYFTRVNDVRGGCCFLEVHLSLQSTYVYRVTYLSPTTEQQTCASKSTRSVLCQHMAHHCTGWHCLAQTIFGGFNNLHCAIQHSDCQETYSSSPSPSTPILHLFPAPFAQRRLAHKWLIHPGLIHLWLEPDGGPSPDPYLPWRPLSTSHHSFCSPPSRRHSIPRAISTICAVTRQLLPQRSESYGAAFPLVTPLVLPRCTSLSVW